LSISPIDEIDYCMRHVRHMELIVYHMLNDGKLLLKKKIQFYVINRFYLGYRFDKPEYIMANLQQGIW
jgi:hypothetical protein